jgi:hypothetical protein
MGVGEDMLPLMETPMDETEPATRDETEPVTTEGEGGAETKPAGETEAYESEWYEVLKRRAEELEDEGDEADDAV